MRAVAFIQARMGSKRLPGKVLLPMGKEPLLGVLIGRVRACPGIQEVVVSTSPEPSDDQIGKFCSEQGLLCSRHPVDDIVGRLHASLSLVGPVDYLVRFWGDSPFVCPELVNSGLARIEAEGASFFTTGYPKLSFPGGIDFEIYRPELIRRIHESVSDPFFREFPYEYVKAHAEVKRTGMSHEKDLSNVELSVDYPEDLEVARKLFADLRGEERVFSFRDILRYIEENPRIFDKNSDLSRNIEYKQKLQERKK